MAQTSDNEENQRGKDHQKRKRYAKPKQVKHHQRQRFSHLHVTREPEKPPRTPPPKPNRTTPKRPQALLMLIPKETKAHHKTPTAKCATPYEKGLQNSLFSGGQGF